MLNLFSVKVTLSLDKYSVKRLWLFDSAVSAEYMLNALRSNFLFGLCMGDVFAYLKIENLSNVKFNKIPSF